MQLLLVAEDSLAVREVVWWYARAVLDGMFTPKRNMCCFLFSYFTLREHRKGKRRRTTEKATRSGRQDAGMSLSPQQVADFKEAFALYDRAGRGSVHSWQGVWPSSYHRYRFHRSVLTSSESSCEHAARTHQKQR